VAWRFSIAHDCESLGRAKGLPCVREAFADSWRAGDRPAMARVENGDLPWLNWILCTGRSLMSCSFELACRGFLKRDRRTESGLASAVALARVCRGIKPAAATVRAAPLSNRLHRPPTGNRFQPIGRVRPWGGRRILLFPTSWTWPSPWIFDLGSPVLRTYLR